jgi:hypothetical protein
MAAAPLTPLEIVPLTPETWPALAALFEEGGDPKWCWYQWQVGGGLRVSRSRATVARRERRSTDSLRRRWLSPRR